jgi:predicted metalloprotease
MRWEGGRESENVEDRRGAGGGGFGFGGRSIGLGTVAIAVVAGYFFGVSPATILSLLSGGGAPVQVAPGPRNNPPADDQAARFVSVVLADTEDTWTALFKQKGGSYRKPGLVLFSGATGTACGTGEAAAGPFYCPADEKVYIDLSFYRQLQERFKAPGEFAQAYVIAHEVGHHVQKQLGMMAKVDALRGRATEEQVNRASVRLELQADCFAGIWAHRTKAMGDVQLDPGDIEQGLRAAAAVGDDTMQKRARGYVVPESFTHGTSEQRMRWFRRGVEQGSIDACNTFEGQI